MTHFSFPKSKRLLKSRQFRRVGKYGQVASGKYLNIQVCESKKSTLKLGLTVSRKFGKATKRNRFKRLVREAFRLSQHGLPPQIHLNVRPTKDFDGVSLDEIKDELISACEPKS